MKKIYTDGACKGNPGKGGWAFVVLDDKDKEVSRKSGSCREDTTNNRMEMQAVISGLKSVDASEDVEVYSDSAYVVNCFKQKWMVNWKRNGWVNSKKSPVENRDLWEALDNITTGRFITFIKVKGHSDNKFNNIVDVIASSAAREA